MLEQFRSYLSENARFKVKYIPYYVKWVAECHQHTQMSADCPISADQKQQFLTEMAKSHEDWRVRQADKALRLYNFFLSRHGKRLPSNSAAREKEWRILENNTRKALRFRQRSLSTEKSYVIWLRQFRGFIASKSPQELEGTEIRDFLTHLAVERKVSSSTQSQA